MWSPEADTVASPPEPDEWVDSPGPGSEVSRSHWMPEEAFKRCTNPACGKEFTQRRRKHHCRCCGNVYCSKCTGYVLPLNPLSAMIEAGGVKAKVCELCYERAVDEGYAESTGSDGDGEADSSVGGAQGYHGADSPAAAPADTHTHASAANAGPSTLSDRLSHARPPSSLEEDIFGARPRLRAAMLQDHRPHSSGGRVVSSAFPRFNSISGAGNAHGSGTGGAGGSGSISIGGVGMGGRLQGSGGSGDLFQRSSTLSASHERAIRAPGSGLSVEGGADTSVTISSSSTSSYSAFAGAARSSSSSSAVSTSTGGESSRGAGDRVRVLQRYRHLSVSLDEERGARKGRGAAAGAWAAADRAAAAGPQHLDLAGGGGVGGTGGGGGLGGRVPLGLPPRADARQKQQLQQQGQGEGSRGGSGGSMRGGTAGPGNKIGLSLDLLAKMNFPSQPSPSHPSPSYPSSAQPSPSLTSEPSWKRPSPLHSPASAIMSPQPFSPSPGRSLGAPGGPGGARMCWQGIEERRGGGQLRGGLVGGVSMEEQERAEREREEREREREEREREERERVEGEQRRREELYEELGAGLLLESPSAHVKGHVKSVQLHDLLAAWEKGESILDSTTTTTVSPLPAVSPLPTVAPLPAGSPLPTTASPLTLLETISHRMGLAPTPPALATALEQRGEGRGETGHEEAAEAAAAGGAGKGPSAEAIQRLLWTDGQPTAVPASATAAAPDTAAEPAASAEPAATSAAAAGAGAAAPGDASPHGASRSRGEALDQVKRSLAASMGAAGEGGDGRTARSAAASGASGAPQEPTPPKAKPPGLVVPGASDGAAPALSASVVRAAPASLLQWSPSDVLHWLHSSVPFRSAPAAQYAADFEKAGVEGITLVGMTRGHPALANMRPADLVAFEMASQVERRRVVAGHAAGQPAPELGPRPATAVGVAGMDSQQLRPGQAGHAGQAGQQQAKLVPPRQFRALHLDGFSSASSRATTPADTPHSTDSRILNPIPARPATAAAGSGGGGGQKKGAGSSGSGGGWLFGWSTGAAKESPASAEAVDARDEVAAAEEREQTAKAKLSHLDAMLKRSLLVEYLHTRQRWAPMGGEGPLPVDDPEAEDEWLPRFVALSANEVSCYRQASDLDPEVSIPLDSVAAAGTLEAGGEAGEEAEDWLVFHLTTGYGLRLECATRSRVKLQLWLATIHEAVENLLDFLPFKCDACHQPFCLEHRSYGAHECPDVHVKDVTVTVCPKCSSSFRTSRFEDAERALARHMGGSDCQAASAERRTKCPVRGCRQRLTTSNRAKCRSCAKDHCLQHRLASDHHCAHRAASSATMPTRAEGKGAGQRFLDALAKRNGGECAQSNSSGSSSDSAKGCLGVSPSVKAH
ncbi:unnamed protein product [Closterium sp. Yama58-4]|nr:unnamed protein product [Closterium sp. Yama58-4]